MELVDVGFVEVEEEGIKEGNAVSNRCESSRRVQDGQV